jgi:tRNA (uracil-5-)-methyltransferase TRM9
LEDKEVDYTGVDFCDALLSFARKTYPKLDFVHSSVLSLPLENDSFDVVVSTAVLHHLPSAASRIEGLQEVLRVLRPGGLFVFTVWDLWQWKNWRLFCAALLRSIRTFGNYRPSDLFVPFGSDKVMRYYHAFTKRELRMELMQAGFTIVKLDRSLGRRRNMFVVCKKNIQKSVQQPAQHVPVLRTSLGSETAASYTSSSVDT